jgi:glutamate-1-semialdehyde 2,1-aminomutase
MSLVSPSGPCIRPARFGQSVGDDGRNLVPRAFVAEALPQPPRALGTQLAAGLADAARDAGIALQVNAVGSLLTAFFTDQPVRNYASATSARADEYGRFFRGMLARGIYPPPSQFEAWFLSAAHTTKDVDRTIAAARAAMKDARKRM